MPIFKTEKQKDNLAKFSYDVAKIFLALTVIGPLAKPEGFKLSAVIVGIVVAILFCVLGYLFDAWEVK
jgi:hypothetical protein